MFSRRPARPRFLGTRRRGYRPHLESLEDRLAPAGLPLAAINFDPGAGMLTLGGTSAQVAVSADDAIVVSRAGQMHSSDPTSANFDSALTGASAATLHGIYFSGGAADTLTLDDTTTIGNLTINAYGGVTLSGKVSVSGQLTVTAETLTVTGATSATGLTLTSAGLLDLESDGSLVAQSGGTITAAADDFVNVGQVRADGTEGGHILISTRAYLNAGTVSAAGSSGAGGTVRVGFSASYIDTATAKTSVSGTQGTGGWLTIDGGSESRLFSSGVYDATGISGGAIDLFGQNIALVAATVDASGATGSGGAVRVGGGYQGKDATVPNAQTVDVTAATSLRADGITAGGHVVIWSEASTTFAGSVSARGQGGGFVEISSHGQLTYGGQADTGTGGTLLLDPQNLVVSAAPAGVFPQFKLINPGSGGAFGTQVVTLSTGNMVVTDPRVNNSTGAVYLFNGQTGALLSTLQGSAEGDQVGNVAVTALLTANYVVDSPAWSGDAGAVTWGSGTVGVSGVVSASNSLVGSTPNIANLNISPNNGDQVGSVTALSNGNYVVDSPGWNGGRGAVTWGSGTVGVRGVVSASNSLVGSNPGERVAVLANASGTAGSSGVVSASNGLDSATPGDQVGNSGVTALANGNYLVDSTSWSGDAGAVTWGSGTTGISGVVSAANSLVGANAGDQLGSGVTVLTNGNYIVASSYGGLGAVTWGSGTAGVRGVVSASNSLVGSSAGDEVGSDGVTPLTNGNYVVSSPYWNGERGAATWGSGTTGVRGVVSAANSLVGNTVDERVSASSHYGDGVAALTNGNYVVLSNGAVTWGSGTVGVDGVVSASNSLVGTNAGDEGGISGVTVLSNGNYVVDSPSWNGSLGAVTWESGTVGLHGVVSAANSLVGANANAEVGSTSVTALTNGNFVVTSSYGSLGAVTWGSGTAGVTGVVSATNSLVGSHVNDQVGNQGITVLANGNYVVESTNWSGSAGAVTWGNGTAGVSGVVSASNSLVGANAGDFVVNGGGVTALPNGNYVVDSPDWNGSRGAVTWGNGTTGVSGVVSASNSLVGSNPDDEVGFGGVTVLPNGNFVVDSFSWSSGHGAVTWGSGTAGVHGVVSANNSLVGTNLGDGVGSGGVTVLPNGSYVVGSQKAATWSDGSSGTTLDGSNTIDPQNSLFGSPVQKGLPLSQVGGTPPPLQLGAVANSFLTHFANNNGDGVTVGFTDPNQLTFALASSQTVTVTPSFLTRSLNADTNVVLQANNDLTINSPINVTPTGTAGNLTLQAGRSILLNASINTGGGNLTLIANQTKANGVVDAERDLGNAASTMAPGVVLATGAGSLSVDLKTSTDKTNNGKGSATLLTLTSKTVTLSSSTVLSVILYGTTAGSGSTAGTYTQTAVSGTLNLGGATLQVGHYAATAQGTTFTIVHTAGGVSGTFAGLAQGATLTTPEGTQFTISYQANGGKDVVLTQISPPGHVLTVQGTAGNDIFSFSAKSPHVYLLNGVSYPVSPLVNTLHFMGNGGSDSATLTDLGGDYAALSPTYVSLSTPGYTMSAANCRNVTVNSSGNATADFGLTTTGADTYKGTPAFSEAVLAGVYNNTAVGFAHTHGFANGNANAIAYLVTSAGAGDIFGGIPAYSFVQGASSDSYALSFAQVDGYSGGTGSTAYLGMSSGPDTFFGLPTYSAVVGAKYAIYAVGFANAQGYSGGPNCRAILKTSANGQDTYIGTPTYSSVAGTNYIAYALGFTNVAAYAGGVHSVAYLSTSTGNDFFVGSAAYSEATNTTSYTNYAIGFTNVLATAGSSNSSADFYDAPGNDTFSGAAHQATETGSGYSVQGTGFGTVRIHSTQGGSDHSSTSALDYVFTKYGPWL